MTFIFRITLCILAMFAAEFVFGNVAVLGQDLSSNIPVLGKKLSDDQAASLAQLALSGMHREYPNKPNNVMSGPEGVQSPRQMHPAFYGCFDWHSSVHGHWMLIRLLRTNPNHKLAGQSRAGLSQSLTKENIAVETAYFDSKDNKSFERMYGWAWLLQTAAELHQWDDADGKKWRAAIRPLEAKIVELTLGYLPRLKQPIRTGVHPDTAFALSLSLDYSRTVGNKELEALIVQRAKDYYQQDRDYNPAFEPSGEDFFSQSMNEIDLMRRILAPTEFVDWLKQFIRPVNWTANSGILTPVSVSDVTDGKLVHLAGLNLSRAGCLVGIAKSLPENATLKPLLQDSARKHAAAGFQYVFSGHYEGEHWLGTFAVYALTSAALE